MTLSIDAVNRLVSTFLREHGQALELVGVTSTEGASDRVELLITIAGCHAEPCRLLINIPRGDRTEFDRQLRSKLAEALANHRRA